MRRVATTDAKAKLRYVYLITPPGFWKIGIATDERLRLTSLQSGNPHLLTLVKTWLMESAAARAAEYAVLSKTALIASRTDPHGRFVTEWRCGDPELAMIDGLIRGCGDVVDLARTGSSVFLEKCGPKPLRPGQRDCSSRYIR